MLIKYHLFLDRRQLISLFFTVFSGWMTAELIRDEGNAWWVLWGIITLLMTAMALALPCLYLMTPKGLHIIHTFGLLRRFIPWDSVAGLQVNYDYDGAGYNKLPYLFDTFIIYGDVYGPTFFFTEDEMVRTLRARILLEKYTGLKVEGFLWQDIRDARKNRKEKKERERRRRQRQERVDRNRRAREAAKREAKRSTDRSVRK